MWVVLLGILLLMGRFAYEDVFHFPQKHPVILLDLLAALCKNKYRMKNDKTAISLTFDHEILFGSVRRELKRRGRLVVNDVGNCSDFVNMFSFLVRELLFMNYSIELWQSTIHFFLITEFKKLF